MPGMYQPVAALQWTGVISASKERDQFVIGKIPRFFAMKRKGVTICCLNHLRERIMEFLIAMF